MEALDVETSRAEGEQALQALLTFVRENAGKLAAHGLTILFLAASSILFFRSLGDIFPFIYASRSPLP